MTPSDDDNDPFGPLIEQRHADTLDARVAAGRDPLELKSAWIVANRYEILGMLGSGGMGTVYRARDRELDEVVALKMLKRQVASGANALERFRREVKLARRVTHRNVARTFDIGEHAGGKFLTMEFIEGQHLGALLAQRGRLRMTDVVRIGKDLCAGLGAAHEAGVLHRDLKPENVIVALDGGRAVITDFGIARALEIGEATKSSGQIVGTPAYMAPEQLEGRPDLDARTDVYALGTILFELLSGEVPWAGETPLRASIARLQGPPPDVREGRPSISEATADLVRKCMARHREDRFGSAAEVSAALDQLVTSSESGASLPPTSLSSASSVVPRPSRLVRTRLAVLAISNDGDRAHDYLADGLEEDLIDVLSSFPEIDVRPRRHGASSSGSVSPQDARALGHELGVDAIVEGSFRCEPAAGEEGDRIFVSFRLVTVEDGFELWARRFVRPTAEMVAIADQAAADIAMTLTVKAPKPPRALPTNPVAHDLYLRGRFAFLRGWYDSKNEATRLLGEAHALSPHNSQIATTYARALARAYGVGSLDQTGARAAQEIAERAIALDPARAEARVALAMVQLYRGESAGAAVELRRAFDASPNDADVHEILGRLRAEVGPLERSIEHLAIAIAREPDFAEARYTTARAWALLGDWERAIGSMGIPPVDFVELVPYFLTLSRLVLWRKDAERATALLAMIEARVSFAPRERRIAEAILGAAIRSKLSSEERATVEDAFPSGSAVVQRLACFNAQMRAEIYLAGGEPALGLEAVVDADANGLVDISWLDRCPLLEGLREAGTIEGARKSTSLRAERVRAVLDA